MSFTHSLNINLTATKGDIILINSLHLKFGLVNCISISQSLNNNQTYLYGGVLKNIFAENILQNIIRASVAKFIFSTATCFQCIPLNIFRATCFQHILLNAFRRMHLKYENYPLRDILFYTLKQYSGST